MSLLKKLKKLITIKEGNKSTPKTTANIKVIMIIGGFLILILGVAVVLSTKDYEEETKDVVEAELHNPTLYETVEEDNAPIGRTKIVYVDKKKRIEKIRRNQKLAVINMVSDSKYEIPPGTLLNARLLNKVISSSQGSPVIALVSKDYYHLKTLAIPKGTKVLGESRHDEASKRIQIIFHTIVFPNQRAVTFSGIALDQKDNASAGLSGKYKSKKGFRITGSLLSNFIGGFAEGMQDRETTVFGTTSNKGSVKNAILKGTSNTAMDQSRRYSDKLQDIKGTITVPADYEFVVYVERGFKFR